MGMSRKRVFLGAATTSARDGRLLSVDRDDAGAAAGAVQSPLVPPDRVIHMPPWA